MAGITKTYKKSNAHQREGRKPKAKVEVQNLVQTAKSELLVAVKGEERPVTPSKMSKGSSWVPNTRCNHQYDHISPKFLLFPTQKGNSLGGILTNHNDGRCTDLRSMIENECEQIITYIQTLILLM